MALDDKTLNDIFKKQKKGSIDSLRSLGSLSSVEERRKLIRMEYEEPQKSLTFTQQNEKGNIHRTTRVQPENENFINKQKRDRKPDTNLTQSRHKVDTNLTQTAHKPNTNLTQSRHKVDTQPNTRKTQSGHKPNTNLTQTAHISAIMGIQRMILLFIFEECKKARSHITEPLSNIHIVHSLEIAFGSIKTSITRLCEKGFIKIYYFKTGRGGWSQYEIPDHIYKEMLQMETQHKLHTNLTQSRHKVDTQPNTQPNTSAPSSSSLNIKTTTTELTPEWNFDITSYARFGFTATQLKQLAFLGSISAIDVEQSLTEFSYDLDNNALPAIKTSKINFLMGLMRGGHAYVSEAYRNEQDTMILEMARRTEAKRKNLLEAKFTAWEGDLNVEERNQVLAKLPTHLMVLEKTYGAHNQEVKNWYFDYFIKNVKG